MTVHADQPITDQAGLARAAETLLSNGSESLPRRQVSERLAQVVRNGDETLRDKAIQLLMQALRDALTASDRAEKLRCVPFGAFAIETALDALLERAPADLAALLDRLIACELAEPGLRAYALQLRFDLDGTVAPCRAELIELLLRSEDSRYNRDETLLRLANRHLLALDELAHGLTGSWASPICEALARWPGMPDSRVSPMLIAALEQALAADPVNFEIVTPLVERLQTTALDEIEHEQLSAILQSALDRLLPQLDDDDGYVRHQMQPLLAAASRLGGCDDRVLDAMTPWSAMRACWRARGIDWAEAGRRLTEAGVIDPTDVGQIDSLTRYDEDPQHDPSWTLMALCKGRIAQIDLDPDLRRLPHDACLRELGALLRPPLEFEAIEQQPARPFIALPAERLRERKQDGFPIDAEVWPSIEAGMPVYGCDGTLHVLTVCLAGRSFRVELFPDSGTYLDLDGLIDALNRMLAEIGRDERVRRLDWTEYSEGRESLVLAGPGDALDRVLADLRIPQASPPRDDPRRGRPKLLLEALPPPLVEAKADGWELFAIADRDN